MSAEKAPPEPVDILDLRFRQLRRIDLNSYSQADTQASQKKRQSLIAASSQYGIVFVGVGANLVALKTVDVENLDATSSKEERKNDASNFPAQVVPLPSQPFFISLSSDNLTLAVCCTRNGGCSALFYCVRAFANKDKMPGWFLEARLSTAASVTVTDFAWNPGQGNAYAYCLSDGTVGIAEVVETSLEIKATRKDMNASALSWSPKGKQIFVGTTTGQLVQCKPDLKEVKSIPPPPSLAGAYTVCGILWISTNQVAAVYINFSDPDPRPLFHIVNMMKNAPIEYINYDDICYGGGQDIETSFYNMQHITEWGVIICTSATAAEVAVLGREGTADPPVWQQWNVDGSWRAETPFILKGDQTYPLGSVLDFSAQQRIPWGENETLNPMPMLYLLSTGGALCPFQVINLKPGCPVLTHAPEPLSAEKARFGAPPTPAPLGNAPTQKTTAPFGFTSGFGSALTVQAPKPTVPIQAKAPTSFMPAFSTPTSAPAAAPMQVKAPTSFMPAAPAPSSAPTAASAPVVAAAPAAPAPFSIPPIPKEPAALAPAKAATVVSTQPKESGGNAAAILVLKQGIVAFEEELKAFKQRANKINTQIGTDDEKMQLVQQTASMDSFCSELIATTVAQEAEIRTLKSSGLEAAAWLEEARSRSLRCKDEKYHHLLKLRSLDPASQRKLNEIHRVYDYLTQQLQEAMSKQDQLLQDIRCTPKREKAWLPPSSELIFQTLLRHEHLLGELCDRKEKIIAQMRVVERKRHMLRVPYPGAEAEKKTSLENGGSDLARLAESLLITHGRASPLSPVESQYVQNALSPEKQAFIRDSLSQRPVRVIRTHVPSPSQPSRMLSTLVDDGHKTQKLRPDVAVATPEKTTVNGHPAKQPTITPEQTKQPEKSLPSASSTSLNTASPQTFAKPAADVLNIPVPSTLFKSPASTALIFLENKSTTVPTTAPKPSTPLATFKISPEEPIKTSASPAVAFQGTGFVLGSKTDEKPKEAATAVKQEPKPLATPPNVSSPFSGFGVIKAESSTSLATKVAPEKPAVSNAPHIVPSQTAPKPASTAVPTTTQDSAASALGFMAALASSVEKELAKASAGPSAVTSTTSQTSAPAKALEPSKSAFNLPSFGTSVTSTSSSKPFSFSLPTATTGATSTPTTSAVPSTTNLLDGTAANKVTFTPVKATSAQPQPVSLFKAPAEAKPEQPLTTETEPATTKPAAPFTFALPGTSATTLTSKSTTTTTTPSLFGGATSVFGQAPSSTAGASASTASGSLFGQTTFGLTKSSTAPSSLATGTSIFGQSGFGLSKTPETMPTATTSTPTTNLFGQSTFGTPKTEATPTAVSTSIFGQAAFSAPKTTETTPINVTSTTTTTTIFGQSAFGAPKTTEATPTTVTAATTSVFGQATFGAPKTAEATPTTITSASTSIFGQTGFDAPKMSEARPTTVTSPSATSIFGQTAFGAAKPTETPTATSAPTGSLFGQSTFGVAKPQESTSTTASAAGTTSIFGQSAFGAPKTSTAPAATSIFGQSTFGAPKASEATPTGTAATTGSVFGQSTFGMASTAAPATTASSVFGQSAFGGASTAPATNAFGQVSGFGFGQTATPNSSGAGTSVFGQTAFGSKPTSPAAPLFGGAAFGAKPVQQPSIFGGAGTAAAKPADTFGSTSNAFQSFGLGGSPNPANVNKNVFGGGTFGASGQQSVFGSASAQSSGTFGSPAASAAPAFGAFGSPNKPVFGVSASFGSPPAFGAASLSPAKTFGAAAADAGAGFGNFANANTLPTFGALASNQAPQFGAMPAAAPQPPAPAPSFGSGTAFSSWR